MHIESDGEMVRGNSHCVFCDKRYATAWFSRESYIKWKHGEFIQNAIPEILADDREFLISGICPTCFNGLEETEDDDAPF